MFSHPRDAVLLSIHNSAQEFMQVRWPHLWADRCGWCVPNQGYSEKFYTFLLHSVMNFEV